MSLIKILPDAQKNTGWPWTEETDPEAYKERVWPKISIITPSYNQGEFIEETIRSILLQNYPNLEYIIMDAGSTDDTVEIIKKYEPWIAYWVSEKDRGQSHAINKGIGKATGDIIAYLNSDDLLLDGALRHVASIYQENFSEDKTRLIMVGDTILGKDIHNEKNKIISHNCENWSVNNIAEGYGIAAQPAVFWTKNNILFNEELQFSMDYDYWYKLIKSGYQAFRVPAKIAFYRIQENAKSTTLLNKMWIENSLLTVKWIDDFQQPLDKITQIRSINYKLRFYFIHELRNNKLWTRKLLLRFVWFQLVNFPALLFNRVYLKFLIKKIVTTK